MKGLGGAVGLVDNPSAFRKWTIAGPEQARLLKEFECEYMRETTNKQLHHEEGLWMQKVFKEQAQSLVQAINEMGNPFLHDTPELLKLDTRDVLDESVVTTVRTVEKLGTNSIMSVSSRTGLPQSMKLSKRILCRCLAAQNPRQRVSMVNRSQC